MVRYMSKPNWFDTVEYRLAKVVEEKAAGFVRLLAAAWRTVAPKTGGGGVGVLGPAFMGCHSHHLAQPWCTAACGRAVYTAAVQREPSQSDRTRAPETSPPFLDAARKRSSEALTEAGQLGLSEEDLYGVVDELKSQSTRQQQGGTEAEQRERDLVSSGVVRAGRREKHGGLRMYPCTSLLHPPPPSLLCSNCVQIT